MGSPSLTPGQWDTSLYHAAEKEGGWQKVGITSADLKALLTPADFMSLFPVGAVMMWDDHTTIPANWEVIPESVQRVPRGVAAPDTALVTGGTDTHLHDPHANHVVTQATAHSGNTSVENLASVSVTDDGTSQVNVAAPNHTHLFISANHTGADVDAHSAHSSASHVPANFTVFFIRKVA